MMRITFKNVGQGDSIILEWEDKGLMKIGIIDCNKYQNKNPVLDYVTGKCYKKISFLLLSHPHTDHFSGFTELITHCIDFNISIEYFLHTANNMPAFWRMAIEGKDAETEILKLFKIIREAESKLNLHPASIQGLTPFNEIELGQDFKLKILAPTSRELDRYANNYFDPPIEEENGNNPSANWLSTVIKIHNDDWFVLLTSDCDKSVLKYYGLKQRDELKGRLILAQSAHHGAFKNHNNAFWKLLTKSTKTPVVFSVGQNHYDHPSQDVINFFKKNDFEIFSTNQVGALAIKSPTTMSKVSSLHLDIFSTTILPIKKDKLNGDKIFEIDAAGNLKVI